MSETNFFRLIEAYFDGTIKPTDKTMLEHKVQKDPLLKAEFDLQKSIVEGLEQTRKFQLKQRLNAIDVSVPAPGLISSTTVKWIGSSLVVASLLTALYFWPFSSTSIIPLNLTSNDAVNWGANEEAIMPKNKLATSQNMPATALFVKPTVVPDKDLASTSNITNKALPSVSDLKAEVKPQSLVSFEDEKLFKAENEKLNSLNARSITAPAIAETEIALLAPIAEQKYHYKYFNNKLFLYGNFDEQPYEIVELNNKGNRQLFLSYKEYIYIIEENVTEIDQLSTLKDKMLIKELLLIINE